MVEKPEMDPTSNKHGGSGAIGSLILGAIGIFVWQRPIIGFLVTIIGLLAGIGSLGSKQRKTAIVGITLCSVFLFAAVINLLAGKETGVILFIIGLLGLVISLVSLIIFAILKKPTGKIKIALIASGLLFLGAIIFIPSNESTESISNSKPIQENKSAPQRDISSERLAVIQGDWIYYSSNDNGKLYKIRTDGSGKIKLSDDMSLFINVAGDWVYYRNKSDFGLYKIRTDGSGRTKLSDDNVGNINVVGDWVYYSNWSDDGKLYKIRTDGSGKTKLNDDTSRFINVVGDWVYYSNGSDDGKLYKLRTDGSGRTKLNDDKSEIIKVVDDWVYYRNKSDGDKPYRILIDGSSRARLSDDDIGGIIIVGDWVYYSNVGDDLKLYKIRTDGSDKQLVE